MSVQETKKMSVQETKSALKYQLQIISEKEVLAQQIQNAQQLQAQTIISLKSGKQVCVKKDTSSKESRRPIIAAAAQRMLVSELLSQITAEQYNYKRQVATNAKKKPITEIQDCKTHCVQIELNKDT